MSEKLRQPETSPRERSSKPLPKRMKPVGPKIVAVTSPRPLIVKVQSLIPGQSTKCEDPLANPEMPSGKQSSK